jgi:arginyl-tRNA--protein-N-Asp/Glu arginylyltransferase
VDNNWIPIIVLKVQISFIDPSYCLQSSSCFFFYPKDLYDNLTYFKVPQPVIVSITNSLTFRTNDWIHKIMKRKESDKCDLCETLRWLEDRFTTEEDLPKQDLGHIHDTYKISQYPT